MVGVGRAAAGAVELGPAVGAFGLGVDIAGGKLALYLRVIEPVPDIAQLEALLPHELVAGVQVAPGGHGHVLRAGAAAGDALVDAGPAVDHVVVEGEGPSFPIPLPHQLRQLLVLLLHDLDVLGREGGGIVGGADHGLHAELGEAQLQHLPDVLHKVGVQVGEGAAHVVVLAAAGLHQLLELGHDPLPAAVAGIVHPEAVVNLLAPVQREHHVAHLPVAEVDHLIVDEHAVGGEGEAEVLARLLFPPTGIGHQVLDHLEVHQRLAAEEVHLQVPALAGVLDQKVQGALAHLKAHNGPLAVVLALTCKAIGAVQVAGVRHVQAQGLDDPGALFLEFARHGRKGVRCEELPLVLEGGDLVIAALDLRGGELRVLFTHGGEDGLPALALVQGDAVVGQLVYRVDGTGADVQHDVVAAQLILMDHRCFSFL